MKSMKKTLDEIRELIKNANEDDLNSYYEELEDLVMMIRKKQQSKVIATDTYFSFRNGKYKIIIGDVTLSGNVVNYSEGFQKKGILCIWEKKCKKWKECKCEYYHLDDPGNRIMNYGESPLMKKFLMCEPEKLCSFYNSNPRLKKELVNFKDKILDGIIRLLWLSSEGIKI